MGGLSTAQFDMPRAWLLLLPGLCNGLCAGREVCGMASGAASACRLPLVGIEAAADGAAAQLPTLEP